MKVSKTEALKQLAVSGNLFQEVFSHGSLYVEVYKPVSVDLQQPHTRDEIYVIISGTGEFLMDTERTSFSPGDFLFVPAGVIHRFENFSDDFVTWVFFYGPEGGESP
ncbi:MAG: cupin domain-containing protein [Bacteroidota bacterium]